jgi:hypothetical protein
LAGQPVRFVIDLSAPYGCCMVHLILGDGAEAHPVRHTDVPSSGGCDAPEVQTGLVANHTYATAGAYDARLIVATFPCTPVPPGGQPPNPMIVGTSVNACIGVGAAGQAACVRS